MQYLLLDARQRNEQDDLEEFQLDSRYTIRKIMLPTFDSASLISRIEDSYPFVNIVETRNEFFKFQLLIKIRLNIETVCLAAVTPQFFKLSPIASSLSFYFSKQSKTGFLIILRSTKRKHNKQWRTKTQRAGFVPGGWMG